jgi:hypothetical protein
MGLKNELTKYELDIMATEGRTRTFVLACNNDKQTLELKELINDLYSTAGMKATIKNGAIKLVIDTDKARKVVKRGRNSKKVGFKGKYDILTCGDIKALQDEGKTDKDIIEMLNISRASYYRKLRQFREHKDLQKPF